MEAFSVVSFIASSIEYIIKQYQMFTVVQWSITRIYEWIVM